MIDLAIPWYVALFESFPEAFLVIATGLVLFNIRISPKNIAIIAAISALTTFWIRKLPLLFGIHSLIALVLLVILTILIARIDVWTSLVSVLAGLVVLGVLQSLMIPIIKNLAPLEFRQIQFHPWYYVLFFVPQAVVMVLICYFCIRKGWYLYDLHAEKETTSPK